MRLFLLVIGLLIFPACLLAQSSPPGTDIYLAPLSWENGSPVVGEPVNVINRPGYDNQPGFSIDGTFFLYTSMDTSGQTDIFRYDIESGTTVQAAHTPESEYSPIIMTGGTCFSTVRVEADGTQRLWQFDLDGSNPRLVLTRVDSVGYHAWLDDSTLALFVLGEPHTLRVADIKTDTDRIIASNIGRCVQTVHGTGKLSFVHKVSENEWLIKQYDPAAGEFETLADCLPGSEDFVWTPGGDILMAGGAALFIRTGDGMWQKLMDFEKYRLNNITRLAIDPQGRWLAMVADDQ